MLKMYTDEAGRQLVAAIRDAKNLQEQTAAKEVLSQAVVDAIKMAMAQVEENFGIKIDSDFTMVMDLGFPDVKFPEAQNEPQHR